MGRRLPPFFVVVIELIVLLILEYAADGIHKIQIGLLLNVVSFTLHWLFDSGNISKQFAL